MKYLKIDHCRQCLAFMSKNFKIEYFGKFKLTLTLLRILYELAFFKAKGFSIKFTHKQLMSKKTFSSLFDMVDRNL